MSTRSLVVTMDFAPQTCSLAPHRRKDRSPRAGTSVSGWMLSLPQTLPSKSLSGQVSSCMLGLDIEISAIGIMTRLLTSDPDASNRRATGRALRAVSIVSYHVSLNPVPAESRNPWLLVKTVAHPLISTNCIDSRHTSGRLIASLRYNARRFTYHSQKSDK